MYQQTYGKRGGRHRPVALGARVLGENRFVKINVRKAAATRRTSGKYEASGSLNPLPADDSHFQISIMMVFLATQ